MAQTLRIPGGLPDVTEIGPDGTVRPTLRTARDPFARTAGDIQMAARTAPGVPRPPVMRNASPAIRDVTTSLRTNPPRLNIMGANDGPRPQPLGAPNLGPELPGGMRPNAGPTPQPMGAPNAGPAQRDWAARPAATPFTPPEKPTLGWFRSALRRGGELATSARSNVGAAGRTAGAVAVDAGKITAPTAAGFGAAALVNNLRQSAADSAPAFVAPEAKPGDIPTINPATGKPDPGPAVNAGSFLNQTETGRNVGNAIMALPGGGAAAGAVQGALRAAPLVGRAAQVAGLAATATPAAIAAAQGYAGGDIATAGTASPAAQAAAAPSTQPPVTDGPLDTRSFPAPTGAPPNEVLRNGNSFSGTNVRDGFTYTGDGAPKGTGTVSALNTIGVGGYQRQLDNIRGLGSDGPVNQTAGGIGGGRVGDSLREKTDAGRTPAGLSARQAANLQQQEAALAQQKEIAGKQIASQNQGQNQGLRIAEMNNSTSRENNAATQRTNLRGQDMEFEGRMIPVEVARQQRLRAAQYMGGKGGAAGGAPPAAGGRYAAAAENAAANGDDALAQHFSTLAAAEQTRGSAADTQARARTDELVDLFRSEDRFHLPDPKDPTKRVFDQDAAKKAAAMLYGQFGDKLAGMSLADKQKAAAEIVGRQQLQENMRLPEKGLLGSAADLVGLYDEPAANTSIPNLEGAKLRRAGWNITPGRGVNDTIVEMPDGTTYNTGKLNDVQRRVLRDGQNGQR